jgi:hypothetical protein
MNDQHQIPIWFFIGAFLLIYGVRLTTDGLYSLVVSPPQASGVAVYNLHSDIRWGAFMSLVGLF